jgi:hypothetical protein
MVKNERGLWVKAKDINELDAHADHGVPSRGISNSSVRSEAGAEVETIGSIERIGHGRGPGHPTATEGIATLSTIANMGIVRGVRDRAEAGINMGKVTVGMGSVIMTKEKQQQQRYCSGGR